MPRVLLTGFCAVPGPRRAGVQMRHVIRSLTPFHTVDLLVVREGEQAYVERQESQIEEEAVEETSLYRPDERTLLFLLGELPFITGLYERARADLPCGWVAGDDEFGRCAEFRAELRRRRLRYVLDVPCNTLIRDLGEAPVAGQRRPPWRRVDAWAQAQPASRWRRLVVGDGSQ